MTIALAVEGLFLHFSDVYLCFGRFWANSNRGFPDVSGTLSEPFFAFVHIIAAQRLSDVFAKVFVDEISKDAMNPHGHDTACNTRIFRTMR